MTCKRTARYFFHALVVFYLALSVSGCSIFTDHEKKRAATESEDLTVPVFRVKSKKLHKDFELPAELLPFRDVKVHSKVKGFVSWIGVDRGSKVKAGQIMIKLSAPELDAKCDEARSHIAEAKAAQAEARSNYESANANRVEVKAKLDSDKLTLLRLKKAALTPGAIALNEVDIAQKTVEGDAARLEAAESKELAAKEEINAKMEAARVAEHGLESLEETREYLLIKAPFDGVITERWVHEGDMAGMESSSRNEEEHPLLRLIEPKRLRLVVSIPEVITAQICQGDKLDFSVPAYLGKHFSGIVSRIGHSLDTHTRTMPVELDVKNDKGELEPGMYATVQWQFNYPEKALVVPVSSVLSTLEKTFVVVIKDGFVHRVSVTPGQTIDGYVQIAGDLKEGETVALTASEELKPASKVTVRPASEEEIRTAIGGRAATGGE